MNRIIKVIQWLPIIWADEDYDYAHLLKLIQFKVERMAAHHKKHRLIAHWSHVVLEMDKFRHLCELQKEDADDEWSPHYYQWCANKDINSKCANEKSHTEALDKSFTREKRNWHNIWTYLDKHAQGWWD